MTIVITVDSNTLLITIR